MYEYVSFIGLLAVFIYREYLNQKERQDLLDRLMSRNFEEFKARTASPEENDFEEEDSNLVDIMEAREDVLSPGA